MGTESRRGGTTPHVILPILTVFVATALTATVLAEVRPLTGMQPTRAPSASPYESPEIEQTATPTPSSTTAPPEETAVAEPMPTIEPSPRLASALELLPVDAPAGSPDPRRMLAMSPDGLAAAFVNEWTGPGPLLLTRNEQETVKIELGPHAEVGPGAAAFSPDGTWLAVVDGAGTLWRVDLADLSAKELIEADDGFVFGRWLRFAGDDRLIVNLVGSSTVPLPSVVATIDLGALKIERLTDGGWERGGWPQRDGSLLYASILPDGGASRLVVRAPDGSNVVWADLGIATWLDESVAGAVTYSDLDGNVRLMPTAESTRVLGRGSIPRFSPDGDEVAFVSADSASVSAFDLSGERVGEVSGVFAGWSRRP